ncbi:MAG: hypothetical protein ABIH99_00925 [Candidatus Micrarchaeota archaeon]
MKEEIPRELKKAWKDTCKVVLGEEIGELEAYLPWLAEYTNKLVYAKSSISGKQVTFTMGEYCSSSKRISLDEVDFNAKYAPLNINEIKDIDSLARAVSERVCYTGNIVLGNSSNVHSSSNIMDGHFIYNSAHLGGCKYIAYGTVGRQCEYCFGGNAIAESSTCIKCHETTRDKRSFELWFSQSTSDSYYSFNLKNCSNAIFCFNLQNKNYCVGNIQLEKEKYSKTKVHLISQIADELKRKKKVIALLDIINASKLQKPPSLPAPPASKEILDKKQVEEAFKSTTRILLGKEMTGGLDAYASWLSKHIHPTDLCKSAASSAPLWRGNYGNNTILPKERLVSLEESRKLGELLKLENSEMESIDLHNAHKFIGKLAYLVCEWYEGTQSNLIDCTCYIDSANCYRTCGPIYSKYAGYSFWPKGSQYAFGADTLFDSSTCVNCYYSTRLTRCFELDGCSNCSDSYFCHNCENLSECMFCFNVKSKRYAVGNVEIGKEEYLKLKALLLAELSKKLEKDKTLDIDIYNIGCSKKSRKK